MNKFVPSEHPRSNKNGEFVAKPAKPLEPRIMKRIPESLNNFVSYDIINSVDVLEEKFMEKKVKTLLPVPESLTLPSYKERTKVVALRGIPGSGKSTLAKQVIASNPGKAVRINNDDINTMMFGIAYGVEGSHVASLLRSVRLNLLKAALKQEDVKLVIIDNTNLSVKTLKELENVARINNADFIVEDSYLSVPLEVCIARDAAREVPVGEKVIKQMHSQASRLTPYQSDIVKVKPYHNDASLPNVVIVDVDGTVATMGERKPYDWHLVHLDKPNVPVVSLVKSLIAEGHEIVVMSGRDEICREATQAFLDRHVAPGLKLHMRSNNDNRQDFVIKHELFQEHIENKYHVKFVLDDRDQVVTLWRDSLKLPTFQVDNGDF